MLYLGTKYALKEEEERWMCGKPRKRVKPGSDTNCLFILHSVMY